MKEILKSITIALDWIMHPISYYNELKEYREDYEKEYLSVVKENQKIKKLNRDLKIEIEKEIMKKDNKIEGLIKTIINNRREYETKLHKKQKSINMLRGKYGTSVKKINKSNNVLNELEEYIKRFLYMLNGISDRDICEQCQLDDFTMIMEKLEELKESDK